jgi:plasmid stability protein
VDQEGSPHGRINPVSERTRSGRDGLDMLVACEHAHDMSRMVQIRNVPDGLHRTLKARAAHSGQTLSDYLLAELERLAARPTREEMLARLHRRKRVTLKTPAAVVIREERDSA